MEQHHSPALAATVPLAANAANPAGDFFRLLPTAPSEPPVCRGSMVARPWFGFVSGLKASLRGDAGDSLAPSPWRRAAGKRRELLLGLVTLSTAVAAVLMAKALPFNGEAGFADMLSAAQLALFSVLFAWVSAGFWSALAGFFVSLRGDPHGLYAAKLPRTPLDANARTAVVVPIYNEHVATVFAGLRASCESLAATGALALFDFYVLSDTQDEAIRAEEFQAWVRLREALGDEGNSSGERIFYRVRKRPGKRKAGNIADFCRRWGRNYRYMVVLDADSIMSGQALVSMVRLMEAKPRAGIIQTVPRACGHDTLHARAQQFASRITGPLFTAGMQYWQLGESHYWGHNAILRVEPFMKHCALAPLPGRSALSGEIMSHDFVEAALIRRAGYEVWIAQDVEGSFEQVPPNLLAELQRDRRWCHGNLLNARLIAEPGIAPVHRVMFLTGVMAYASAPLWFAYLLAGTVYWLFMDPSSTALDAHVPDLLGYLWTWTGIMLMLPRALGVLSVWLRGEQAQYGGLGKLWLSAAIEAGLSIIKAPIRMFAHTCFVLAALTGWRIEWQSPPREAHAISYKEAAIGFMGYTLITLEWFFLTVLANPAAVAWLLPIHIPLLLAVPITVATGNTEAGLRLRHHGLLLTPEETHTPSILRAAAMHAKRFARRSAATRETVSLSHEGAMMEAQAVPASA